jgi:hypothetical protein
VAGLGYVCARAVTHFVSRIGENDLRRVADADRAELAAVGGDGPFELAEVG